MVHQLLWSAQADTGLEHCYMRHSATEIIADGLVIGVNYSCSSGFGIAQSAKLAINSAALGTVYLPQKP